MRVAPPLTISSVLFPNSAVDFYILPNEPMERPVTSKPRGICRYYNEPRGCFSKNCKFIHPGQTLTRFDQSKTCKFYAQGEFVSLICQYLLTDIGQASAEEEKAAGSYMRHHSTPIPDPVHLQGNRERSLQTLVRRMILAVSVWKNP